MANCDCWVWVAYCKEPPYLPRAVADTARELAEAVGSTEKNVMCMASKHRRGIIRRPWCTRVYIGEELD